MNFADLFPFLAAIPAVQKVIDLYRQLILEGDLRKAAFTVGAWVVGIGLVFLVAESSFGADLAGANWADKVLFGVALGSTASVVNDFAKRGESKVIDTAIAAALESGWDDLTIRDETVTTIETTVESDDEG